MTDLSPAAQAVLDAACDSLDCRGYISDRVAAALQAVADQVVPENLESYGIRYELLRIAAELENNA